MRKAYGKLRSSQLLSGMIVFLSMVVMVVLLANSRDLKQTTAKAAKDERFYNVTFGPKGEVGQEWNTAKKLLTKLINNHIIPSRILRYNGDEFSRLVYFGNYDGQDYFAGDDFPIKAGEGYYLSFSENVGNAALSLFEDYLPLSELTYSLTSDWQLVSIPEGVIQGLKPFKAEDLCERIAAQGGQAVEIAYQKFLPADSRPSVVIEHSCGSGDPSNNFVIKSGEAFFIQVTQDSTLMLP